MRKLLAPYGEIVDLEVPTNPNSNKGNRGFAFVEFKSYRSCQKAIKELNQSIYKGRTIVLDFSVSKQKFMTAKLEEEGEEGEHQVTKKEKEEEKVEEKPVEEEVIDKEEALRRQRES